MDRIVFLVECPDQPGIVSQASTAVFELGGNILRSDQYTTDPSGGRFYMRIEFAPDERHSLDAISERAGRLGESIGGSVSVYSTARPIRVAIAVSTADHCLLDLLYRIRLGELPAEAACVVSNHANLESAAVQHGVPFHYLPIDEGGKAAQEERLLACTAGRSDVLVLARYMQVLSTAFLTAYGKDVINIHHGLLPSFKGANPYRQAYERGVKLIGATAHYATADLDEGPIIEQAVERVTHRHDVDALKSIGRHLEQIALARAVRAHCEHRVIRDGRRTVVFE